ncbi:MAG: HisA/HisF-related TIM barrel protein [Candidatus Omnitrophica bacterium]|nr:HisA/HisF-related TIM barrel protein [Candidatus Omnitrophota bacterium]MCM8806787.1 HisA/HisF-related TIM barrel protein [Candidatus Omnitrophota bacterium]
MLIIPAIDLKKGDIVRLYKGRFDKVSYYDVEIEKLVKEYLKAGAKRLHIVLLYGAKKGEIGKEELEKIRKILEIRKINNREDCEIQLGGGIREKTQIDSFFNLGINYLIIGTAFLIPLALSEGYSLQDIKFFYQRSGKNFDFEKEVPNFELMEWLDSSVKEKIIISVDYYKDEVALSGWEVTIPLKPSFVIKKFLERGFKRFLITSIESDGTLEGIDLNNLNRIMKEIYDCKEKIKEIIVAGGISKEEDLILLNSLKHKPTGVVIGKALYQKKLNLEDVIKKYQNI